MSPADRTLHFALESPMGLDHYIDVYGPWGFGFVSVVLVMLVISYCMVFVYTKAIRPFQRDQAEIAKQQAEAQASLSITAQTLKETMRESLTHLESLKMLTADQRDLVKLQRQAHERPSPEPDRNAQ